MDLVVCVLSTQVKNLSVNNTNVIKKGIGLC